MRVVLMGPPGSGKGTQGTILSRRLNVPHIAPGNIFRYHVTHKTVFGQQIEAYMNRNEFVPDHVTNAMMMERLGQCQDGFILDGYPRTLQQMEMFKQYLTDQNLPLTMVAVLGVSAEVLMQRIQHRRVCRECGLVYHRIHLPPVMQNQCDACQGKVIQRQDDRIDAFAKRLVDYQRQTVPVVEAMEQSGLPLVHVDGEQSIPAVTKELLLNAERMKAYVCSAGGCA